MLFPRAARVAMRRRDFITVLGTTAAAWPFTARAQQSVMPAVGILQPGSPEVYVHFMEAFRKGLGEVGYVEGKNVVIVSRWPRTDSDRLTELANELVDHHVAVIATPFSLPASLAAKTATATIPIVFGTGGDPVEAGLVASLNRPGSNITGVSVMNVELGAKRLGLLRELLPNASRFSVLVNPKSPLTTSFVGSVKAAAVGWHYEILSASTNREIDLAFGRLVQEHADALLIGPDALFTNRCVQLAILAAHHALPAIHGNREFAEAGGLMSYGPSVTDLFRLVGIYTGRVLKGEKPTDLPVVRRPSSSSLSICKPPKRSGLLSRRLYLHAPTR
jgi:putative tryptophan/tyrosine transport system substrate-binding protein